MAKVRERNGVFVSLAAILSLFAKQANRVTKKLKHESSSPKSGSKLPMTPLRLFSKANTFGEKKRQKKENTEDEFVDHDDGFGYGGLWQRNILRGEKCQPPEFSGVIYYDENGNQISQLPPRSPRVSPLPAHAFGGNTRDIY